jgi:hypothetical protein
MTKCSSLPYHSDKPSRAAKSPSGAPFNLLLVEWGFSADCVALAVQLRIPLVDKQSLSEGHGFSRAEL